VRHCKPPQMQSNLNHLLSEPSFLIIAHSAGTIQYVANGSFPVYLASIWMMFRPQASSSQTPANPRVEER
jgi:hypothetical protein